ncbi:hypothetical protein [Limnospira platensis]|uniref:hypothetical protein n=1 Tax=Limnospira platensis TaxID=118562 RepID=UPI003D6FC58F
MSKKSFFWGEGLLFGRARDSLYHNGDIDFYLKIPKIPIIYFIHNNSMSCRECQLAIAYNPENSRTIV